MQLDDAISQNSPKLKPKKFKPLTEAAWEEIKSQLGMIHLEWIELHSEVRTTK